MIFKLDHFLLISPFIYYILLYYILGKIISKELWRHFKVLLKGMEGKKRKKAEGKMVEVTLKLTQIFSRSSGEKQIICIL